MQTIVDRAEAAACEHAVEWIRRTFHSAFLEGLQQSWDVTKSVTEDGATNSRLHVNITEESWEQSVELVRQLSLLWSEKLKAQGHLHTSNWVDRVFEGGKSSAWAETTIINTAKDEVVVQADDTSIPDDDPQIIAGASEERNEAEGSFQAESQVELEGTAQNDLEEIDEANDANQDIVDDDDSYAEDDDDDDDEDSDVSGTNMYPYKRIRRLVRKTERKSLLSPHDDVARKRRLQSNYTKMKRMIEKGDTYWPKRHWPFLESSLEDIPNRLYTSSRAIAAKNTTIEIVPKSLWEKQRQSDPHNTQEAEPLLEHSNRKRKAGRGKWFGQMPGVQTSQQPQAKQQQDAGRPASMIGNCKIKTEDIKQAFSSHDLVRLETLFHPDSNAIEVPERPAMIFGALKKVGHLRYDEYIHSDIIVERDLPVKARRRRLNRTVKERLGANMMEKNDTPQTYRSKVLRTVRRDNSTAHCWDLDIGDCFMEVSDGPSRRLCAFSSLEVVLTDADACSSDAVAGEEPEHITEALSDASNNQ